jgi:hypothetical protein
LGDLDEDDLASPFRVALEQFLKRLELMETRDKRSGQLRNRRRGLKGVRGGETNLLDDTLGNVELLSTDDDLLTLVKSSEGLDLGSDGRSVAERSRRKIISSRTRRNAREKREPDTHRST